MQWPPSALTCRSPDKIYDSPTQINWQEDLKIPQIDHPPTPLANSPACHSFRGATQPGTREGGSHFTPRAVLSNNFEDALGSSKTVSAANSRLLESVPALYADSSSAHCIEREAKISVDIERKLPSISRPKGRSKHYDHAAHEKIRKHYDYILSWVSNKRDHLTGDDPVDDITIASDNHLSDEFRQMTLRDFTDLSCVIYQDVRLRENDGSPERPQPSKFEPWTRNQLNESRIVLCRAINEQFSRLVTALVLEQARRLAELRIRMQRHDLVTK